MARNVFLFPSCLLWSCVFMDPRLYHGSYDPNYKTPAFPAPYTDHHAFRQYPYNPTYQTTLPGPTAVLPTRPEYVWDVQNGLRQASPPMTPFNSPVSPRTSEGDRSFVSAQPVGFHLVQHQVSLSAMSFLRSVGAMYFSRSGNHTRTCRCGPPFRTLLVRSKTGEVPEPTTAPPHAG